MAEASSRRAQSWSAFSKAGAAVQSSGSSVSNLTELMHKGRNMVKVHFVLPPQPNPVPMHHHLHCSSRPVAVKLALKGALLAELDTDHVGYLCKPSGWCM